MKKKIEKNSFVENSQIVVTLQESDELIFFGGGGGQGELK